jgi:hypothetical protein
MLMMMVVTKILSPVLLLLSFSCGKPFETVNIKEYKFHIAHDDATIKHVMKTLIADFNQLAGYDYLRHVADPADANSAIFVREFQDEGDKVGYGQWVTETTEDNPMFVSIGQNPKRHVRYAMRLEFDIDFLRERIHTSDREKIRERQTLFFHEVGHGMEMTHNQTNQSDVMYKEVSGHKNFDTFFRRVNRYMRE